MERELYSSFLYMVRRKYQDILPILGSCSHNLVDQVLYNLYIFFALIKRLIIREISLDLK